MWFAGVPLTAICFRCESFLGLKLLLDARRGEVLLEGVDDLGAFTLSLSFSLDEGFVFVADRPLLAEPGAPVSDCLFSRSPP